MKKRLTVLLSMTLLALGTSIELQAQMTVGSDTEPSRAALLDVKTQNPDGNNLTSTVGGVVLPRVKLVNINTLEPFIEDNDPDITMLKKSHVGLTVYNLNKTTPFALGIYVWDGQKWIKKGSGSTSFSVGNGLTLSGNEIKLGGSLEESTTISQTTNNFNFSTGSDGLWKINENDFFIKGNGDVGIGTNTPSVKLDINGNTNNDGKITVSGDTDLKSNTTIEGSFTYNNNGSAGKYLMAKDDAGTAEWVSLSMSDAIVVTGTAVGGGNQSIPYTTAPYYSSSQYITLSPGRWLVKMTFLLRAAASTTTSQKVWIKIGLARRPNAGSGTTHDAYDKYRDRVNPSLPTYIETVLDRKYDYTAVTGDIVIDTDTGGRFDLVVIKDQLRPNNSFNWTSGNLQLNGNATENVLLALPLN